MLLSEPVEAILQVFTVSLGVKKLLFELTDLVLELINLIQLLNHLLLLLICL